MPHSFDEEKRTPINVSLKTLRHAANMLDRLQNACVRAGAVAAMLALCAPVAAQAEPPATLRAAVIEAAPHGARLVLDFDHRPEIKDFALPAPQPRLVLDFMGAQLSSGAPSTLPGAGPVRQVRLAQRTPQAARVVLDLAAGARLGDVQIERRPEGGHRMVAPILADQTREPRRIVIDAGHGGHDPGAIGPAGRREKDITLAAARELKETLERRGFEVTLTRSEDNYLQLFDRVSRARIARAELFISLHADASQSPATQGASVYTLSERGERRAIAVAGAQNWELDLAEPPKSDAVRGILMDLAQRETTNRSSEFAALLIDHLGQRTPLLRNSHRNAGFAVLLAPDVPAILIEMGFMTNAEDERRLSRPEGRAKIVEGVAAAVEAFFSPDPQLMAGG